MLFHVSAYLLPFLHENYPCAFLWDPSVYPEHVSHIISGNMNVKDWLSHSQQLLKKNL